MTGGGIDAPAGLYMFAGTPTRVVWWDNTKNIGAAPAPASLTRLTLSEIFGNNGNGGLNFSLGTRDVKPLKPGEASKASGESKADFELKYIGSYYTFACANRPRRFRESNFANNCGSLRRRFNVLPRTWDGTVDASSNPVDSITESWHAEVTFTFDRPVSAGTNSFIYKVGSASIQYSVSGTDSDGCTVSGTSPHFVMLDKGESAGQSLRIFSSANNSAPGQYSGFGYLPSNYGYTIAHSCPDPDNNWSETGPLYTDRNWFSTVGLRTLPSVVGYTHLAGTKSPSTPPPTHYHWSLDAQ